MIVIVIITIIIVVIVSSSTTIYSWGYWFPKSFSTRVGVDHLPQEIHDRLSAAAKAGQRRSPKTLWKYYENRW